ncbi:type II and III secretion system protein family protein [Hyphomonas johnsonii]|uniref:Pilus assembly protein CpaC n=1 Tax=Hyphomonas johnsonii MHS-2 TaxID=1280950 RepID=A0A059FQ02_9PROT|nr:type II and III secretion system protein family protein [Hyphomonas johnsonii]KCZ92765.1 pilus assembly protein CpaC [Hyphomonas johnsonii MHS-2]
MSMSYGMKGALALALVTAVPCIASAAPNGMNTKITAPGQSAVSEHVTLGLSKSMVIELDSPAADVVITDPKIADAVVQTSERIIFRGVSIGQTNAFVFDRNGNQLLNLEISVEVDMTGLHQLIERHVPGARINVEGVNGNVLITGVVDDLSQSDQVSRLVSAYLSADDDTQVVNMVQIAAKDQVMLEVRIVEMQRTAIKQLGINLSGTPGFGDFAKLVEQQLFTPNADGVLVDADIKALLPGQPQTFAGAIGTSNSFGIQGRSLGGFNGGLTYSNYVGKDLQTSFGATIDALERIGIIKTLAEPNIVAMSGESAKFLAGGEFPVPVGQDNNGRVTIEFKPYGVGLGFTPVVLSEGRISLKVSTEVSELTNQGAFQGATQSAVDSNGNVVQVQGITIPALTVRRAESVIELPSGGSMMMAGLIQSKSRQTLDQIPGLKKLPVLGALFQSRDFLQDESELVVIVTPYLVDPTQKNQLRTPADGYANASDAKTIFFGKLNEQYGKDGAPVDAQDYRAPVGFIEE